MRVEPLHGSMFALFHLDGMRVIGATVPGDLAAFPPPLCGTAAAALLPLLKVPPRCRWPHQ